MKQSYARQTGAVPNDMGGRTRVKWGQETTDDDFEEVMVKQVGGNHNGHPRGSGRASQLGQPAQQLPNINQSQLNGRSGSHNSIAANGRSSSRQQINYNGISPPEGGRGRSPSAGISGRTDWKAKYLK